MGSSQSSKMKLHQGVSLQTENVANFSKEERKLGENKPSTPGGTPIKEVFYSLPNVKIG